MKPSERITRIFQEKDNWKDRNDIERHELWFESIEHYLDEQWEKLVNGSKKLIIPPDFLQEHPEKEESRNIQVVSKNGKIIKVMTKEEDYIPRSQVLQLIEEMEEERFPLGERKWCKECCQRIISDLSERIKLI